MQILWSVMKKTTPPHPQSPQNNKTPSATQDLIFSGIPVLFFTINPSSLQFTAIATMQEVPQKAKSDIFYTY